HINFSKIFYFAKEKNIVKKIDGVLFDLGMSSPQIENSKRGFSFRIDGPLDMRMNPNHGISVQNWLLKSNVNKISYVLKTFGEEKFARRIA
ncbi:MAG: 16S rRNA (cytosine(1402)-N(4))-methyltransferase, partial [Buchnera aphidicola]|nr:16S rRNA (cytosine(1402)-N(4))-methyltransferase [Buchnera aphidicola]